MLEKIKALYADSIQTQISASDALPVSIQKAVNLLVSSLLRGNKIIVCGHGRSYANAQLLVANLLNRYEMERPSFPSVLLSLDSAVGSAIVLDNQLTTLYQRQFNAVAQQGDVLIVLSPDGNEDVILDVMDCASTKDVTIIALTGMNNGYFQGLLSENDVEIQVPAKRKPNSGKSSFHY